MRLICSCCVLLVFLGQVEAASFQWLGFAPHQSSSPVSGISADGSVIVGSGDASTSTGSEGFRWTARDGMIGLSMSCPLDVSADGSTIVGYDLGSLMEGEAFLWTSNSESFGLGDLPGGYFDSAAYGVSGDGSVVVGRGSVIRESLYHFVEAFRWDRSEGMVALGVLPGAPRGGWSEALDISADGSVIVGQSSSALSEQGEACVWTRGNGPVGLGDLPGGSVQSCALAVSADGSTIVGLGSGELGKEAFRWTESEGMVGLGRLLGADSSAASSVSADGSIIVGSSGSKMFIWDESHGMRDLEQVFTHDYGFDLGGYPLWSALISDDGHVLTGYAPKGMMIVESWRAVVPEPSSVASMLTAALVLGAFAKRARTRKTAA